MIVEMAVPERTKVLKIVVQCNKVEMFFFRKKLPISIDKTSH